ncbi:hypothetical protein Lbir_0504 [Legionella birminghamensis]|uniref:Uncharacterized protein n=1 Tax=Legionella birminghamensis TaxID=28083 RepID=A0A378ID25_9GAMM|nr:hypothetical protein Lbir_0504 [Legionella birminghamensis]STX33127.1 Uncharacterised protein [Legionella birminghamensis]
MTLNSVVYLHKRMRIKSYRIPAALTAGPTRSQLNVKHTCLSLPVKPYFLTTLKLV